MRTTAQPLGGTGRRSATTPAPAVPTGTARRCRCVLVSCSSVTVKCGSTARRRASGTMVRSSLSSMTVACKRWVRGCRRLMCGGRGSDALTMRIGWKSARLALSGDSCFSRASFLVTRSFHMLSWSFMSALVSTRLESRGRGIESPSRYFKSSPPDQMAMVGSFSHARNRPTSRVGSLASFRNETLCCGIVVTYAML